jgi:penicillin-binding protein 2
VLDVASGKIQARYHLEVAARRRAAPGSAIKPLTLLALLHSGNFDPQHRILCRRTLLLGGHRLNCTHPESPTPFDAAEALAYSCNSYFAAAALRLTDGELHQEFEGAGLTSETGLASKEATGRMSRAASAEQLQLQALGAQGIEVTPLELVNAYRGLAQHRKGNRDSALAVVYAGLEASTAYGMAHAAQPDGMAVAGKTGTAGSDTSPLTHGWFAGYAPANDPRIVLVVYLEHGRGMDAAGLARKIFTAYREVENKL